MIAVFTGMYRTIKCHKENPHQSDLQTQELNNIEIELLLAAWRIDFYQVVNWLVTNLLGGKTTRYSSQYPGQILQPVPGSDTPTNTWVRFQNLVNVLCIQLAITVSSFFLFSFKVVNGLLERIDWEKAIQMPVGIIPTGSGNALCFGSLYSLG